MIIAQCPVCKDTLSRGADIAMAPCGHTYHEFCLLEWLKTKPTCPQCRKQSPRNRIKKLFFDFVEDPTFSSDQPEMKVARLEAELEVRDSKVAACEALISNLEAACSATNAKVALAKQAVEEEKRLRKKERSEKDRIKTELCHTAELLKQAMTDKKEVEELRARVNALKDTEVLLKNSAADVEAVTAEYVEQASGSSAMAAVRHLACLLAVLKRELEALKANKRSLRRERHTLMKELAALRRQVAEDEGAVQRVEEQLRQERMYAAGLERENDRLRAAPGHKKDPESPAVRRRSSLANILSDYNTPTERSVNNESAFDLFDSETPGQDRLVIDSRYFDTPTTPGSAAKASRAVAVNPFAVDRRSVATEEEEEDCEIVETMERPKPLGPQLQTFNIMRTHLMAARPTPKPPATYDGLGSRQRCSSPVFGARCPLPAGSLRKFGRSAARKRKKKTVPVGKTLDSFVRRE